MLDQLITHCPHMTTCRLSVTFDSLPLIARWGPTLVTAHLDVCDSYDEKVTDRIQMCRDLYKAGSALIVCTHLEIIVNLWALGASFSCGVPNLIHLHLELSIDLCEEYEWPSNPASLDKFSLQVCSTRLTTLVLTSNMTTQHNLHVLLRMCKPAASSIHTVINLLDWPMDTSKTWRTILQHLPCVRHVVAGWPRSVSDQRRILDKVVGNRAPLIVTLSD